MDNECKEFELPVCIDENFLKWILKTLPNSLNILTTFNHTFKEAHLQYLNKALL